MDAHTRTELEIPMSSLHETVAYNLERYARSGTTAWLARHADHKCTIVAGSARNADYLRHHWGCLSANVENVHEHIHNPGVEDTSAKVYDGAFPKTPGRIRGPLLFDTDAIWALVQEHRQVCAAHDREREGAAAEHAREKQRVTALAERAQITAQYRAKEATERMDDLTDVAAQLRADGLNLWRVVQVSEDGETVLTQGRVPIFVAASAREAIELWRKKVNPPGGVVWLYATEYVDGAEVLQIWQARLKFVRGRWYSSTRLVKS